MNKKINDLKNKLNNIEISNISKITIRTIGLLDTFGKMIIDIQYKDNTNQHIEIISPVPTNIITNWLDTNKLLDKTILYKF